MNKDIIITQKVDNKNGKVLSSEQKRRVIPNKKTADPVIVNDIMRNTSKYKGVSWEQLKGKWKVRIRKDGKYTHIAYVNDEIEGAQLWDEVALSLHGMEYIPYLNFPEEATLKFIKNSNVTSNGANNTLTVCKPLILSKENISLSSKALDDTDPTIPIIASTITTPPNNMVNHNHAYIDYSTDSTNSNQEGSDNQSVISTIPVSNNSNSNLSSSTTSMLSNSSMLPNTEYNHDPRKIAFLLRHGNGQYSMNSRVSSPSKESFSNPTKLSGQKRSYSTNNHSTNMNRKKISRFHDHSNKYSTMNNPSHVEYYNTFTNSIDNIVNNNNNIYNYDSNNQSLPSNYNHPSQTSTNYHYNPQYNYNDNTTSGYYNNYYSNTMNNAAYTLNNTDQGIEENTNDTTYYDKNTYERYHRIHLHTDGTAQIISSRTNISSNNSIYSDISNHAVSNYPYNITNNVVYSTNNYYNYNHSTTTSSSNDTNVVRSVYNNNNFVMKQDNPRNENKYHVNGGSNTEDDEESTSSASSSLETSIIPVSSSKVTYDSMPHTSPRGSSSGNSPVNTYRYPENTKLSINTVDNHHDDIQNVLTGMQLLSAITAGQL